MINVQQSLITTALGLLFSGAVIVSKQPSLISVGGLVVGGGVVVRKQTKINQQLEDIQNNVYQQQLTIQKTLIELNDKLENQDKELKTQYTRSRLAVSAIQDIQKQLKINSAATVAQKQQLDEFKQKALQLPFVPAIEEYQPVTRVYLDGSNLFHTLEELKIKLDYQAFKLHLAGNSEKTVFKYYIGVHEKISNKQQQFIDYLKRVGYQVIKSPIVSRNDGTFKTMGDDIRLATDMLEETQKGDKVIVVSNDGDFIPALEKIKTKGAEVTIVANNKKLNPQLRKIGDHFISLNQIKEQVTQNQNID